METNLRQIRTVTTRPQYCVPCAVVPCTPSAMVTQSSRWAAHFKVQLSVHKFLLMSYMNFPSNLRPCPLMLPLFAWENSSTPVLIQPPFRQLWRAVTLLLSIFFSRLKYSQLSCFSYTVYALHQFCCPSLDSLENLNAFPELRGTELNTEFKVWPPQC